MVPSRETYSALAQLRPPYDRIYPLTPVSHVRSPIVRSPGEAVIWRLGVGRLEN